MKILLTIAARGGSKGVKNKNIRLLAGKPLIAHSILQAKKWGKADKIVVSTDSREIAAVAKDFGAEVPFERPAELATDTAGKLPVLRHALEQSEKTFGTKFDILVDLDATAPVRTSNDLDQMLELFLKRKPKSLFSAVPSAKSPYFNMIEEDAEGWARLSKPPAATVLRRQDAPVVYAMNASIYFYQRDYILDPTTKSAISNQSLVYSMPEISSAEVDSELDFQFLEFLASQGLWKP